ncbi:pyruvate kinase [Gryllotalpicola sp.]|uniref:pyruvate kinase n=1 Tax=Gryllotalpicola sp. TaxID=1932787 RepID=UPI00262A4985|nr:pyruvate kinase [Gryllotalpicola sp.]
MPNEEAEGSATAQSAELDALFADVSFLRQAILDAEVRNAAQIEAVRPNHRYSAANLIHYVELRRHDMRELQARLSDQGLSSLGRTESHVLVSIDALLRRLARLTGRVESDLPLPSVPDGAELLSRNAVALLGPQPAGRVTRIMVTLPTEAASDPPLVRDMLESGMDIARINCAHDDPATWEAMLANIRAGTASSHRPCLVSMDLGGPKLRTGPIQPGPSVLKVRPSRDALGAVIEPARVWLGTPPPDAGQPSVPAVPLQEPAWVGSRRVGERIQTVDARGARRTMTVERVTAAGCLVSLRQTAYLVPGMILSDGKKSGTKSRNARIGPLPQAERTILVRRGDRIVLSDDLSPVEPTTDALHRIGCTLPDVFADARPGERVLLDDGKISGVITAVSPGALTVEVRAAGVAGTKLGAEKGINLPDTRLSLSALTEQDIEDLEFVKGHADIVEMSFVRSENDVRDLLNRLDQVPEGGLGVVLKIETVAGFDALPQILLEAMRWDRIGVMIARGDLAVEVGFERLSEVQEEILWLCEAAHAPVIWATEVLDSMARTGIPSRAEVTDAAMAERAECVMLNKGPYIDEAIRMLAGILGRMQDHMQKKRSLLRRLRAWDREPVEEEGVNGPPPAVIAQATTSDV